MPHRLAGYPRHVTAKPPDPTPENTPGLEKGGGVRPGDTPPESGSTSGLSHPQEDEPSRATPAVTIVLIVLAAVAVAGILAALALTVLDVW